MAWGHNEVLSGTIYTNIVFFFSSFKISRRLSSRLVGGHNFAGECFETNLAEKSKVSKTICDSNAYIIVPLKLSRRRSYLPCFWHLPTPQLVETILYLPISISGSWYWWAGSVLVNTSFQLTLYIQKANGATQAVPNLRPCSVHRPSACVLRPLNNQMWPLRRDIALLVCWRLSQLTWFVSGHLLTKVAYTRFTLYFFHR